MKAIRKAPFAFIVLAASLLIALVLWQYVQTIVDDLARAKFEHDARQAEIWIRNRLSLCVNEMYSARGFFAGSQKVEREEWRAYVLSENLKERYTGIVGAGYIERVPAGNRDAFLAELHSDKTLQKNQIPPVEINPGGERGQYFVVKYIEPLVANARLLGLDVFADPRRSPHVQNAIDSGKAAATGILSLPHFPKGDSFFEIYLPQYEKDASILSIADRRQAVSGVLFGIFNASEFISGALNENPMSPAIDVEIFDGELLTEENLLYDRDGIFRADDFVHHPRFMTHSVINIADHAWSLRFHVSGRFGLDPLQEWLPLLVLIGGLGGSFLLFGILYSLAISRATSQALSELASIVESTDDAVIGMDLRGIVTSWNPAAERIYGYSAKEIIGMSLEVLLDRERPRELKEILERIRHEGRIAYYETVRIRKDGTPVQVSITVSSLRGLEGRLKGIATIDRDITQLRQVRELLEQSRYFYLTLFERFPAMIWRSAADGSRDYFNKTWLEFTGRTADREYGSGWESNLHPDDAPAYRRVYEEGIRKHEPFEIEYRLRRKDDQYRWLVDHGIPFTGLDGRFSGFIGSSHDITDRKKSETDLRHSLDLLFAIIENIPDMIFLKDAGELRFELFNKAGEELVGYKREELIGKNDYDFFPKEQADFFTRNDYEVLAERKPRDIPQEYIQTRDKGERILHTKKMPILPDEKGDPQFLLGISEDITDRRQAEEALRDSEERLRATLDNSPAVVYLKDPEGRFILVNRRFETLFGWTRDKIQGKTDQDVFPGEIAEALRSHEQKVFQTRKPLELEETFPQKDGPHTYLSVKFPLQNAAGVVYAVCSISTDITERKRAEEELRRVNETLVQNEKKLRRAFEDLEKAHIDLKSIQTQLIRTEKFAAIGKLSGIVSHEFRNQLGVIRNSAYFIKMRLKSDDEKVRQHLDILEKEIQETDRIIENILTFARKNRPELKPVQLKDLLDENLRRIERFEGVTVKKDYDPVPVIQADAVLLSRVFLNILMNAAQAMKNGGVINLRLKAEGQAIRVVCEDNGPGIREEDKKKLFDPLFSTKVHGTGLGLATAKTIVEAHGGTIDVDSVQGHGTTVTVRLTAT